MRPAIFLDRDGTLNPDPGYISDPDDFELYSEVGIALKRLQDAGYLLVLVTNQSGVARGLIKPEQLEAIHAKLKTLLENQGVTLDAIYHCPHHPDFGSSCECRKPQPGMIHRANKDLNIDLANSFMIGDRDSDVKMAINAGVTPVLVRYQKSEHPKMLIFADLNQAADYILTPR